MTNLMDKLILTYKNNHWSGVKNCDPISSNYTLAMLKSSIGSSPIYVYDPEDDNLVSGAIVETGIWEANTVNLMADIMKIDPRLDFIDIGANLGVYSLTIAALGRKVVAVEPYLPTQRLLCHSIMAGNFHNEIFIINHGLSNTRTNISFAEDFINGANIGGMKIREVLPGDKLVSTSIKLDDLLQVFNLSKVVMKIDVETHEYQVLMGGYQFFENVDVKLVLMEWHWASLWHKLRIFSFMEKFRLVPHDVETMKKLTKKDIIYDRATFKKRRKKNYVDIIWIKVGYRKFYFNETFGHWEMRKLELDSSLIEYSVE